jgi:hypothetical protein
MVYQMDVKSAFLNGPIKKKVYEEYPNHVYKLHKTLYEFKQAPRVWYECLRNFLTQNCFKIGKADSTLFTRKVDNDLFICQFYVDGIIFGSTDQLFVMSLVGL